MMAAAALLRGDELYAARPHRSIRSSCFLPATPIRPARASEEPHKNVGVVVMSLPTGWFWHGAGAPATNKSAFGAT
jgi:hypothetical protein